jgi:hypothetical protein
MIATMDGFECLNSMPWLVPVGLFVIVLVVKVLLDFLFD